MIDRQGDVAAVVRELIRRSGVLFVYMGMSAGALSVHLPDPMLARVAISLLVCGSGLLVLDETESATESSSSHGSLVTRVGLLAALAGVAMVPLATLPSQPFRRTALAGGFLLIAGVTLAMVFEMHKADWPADGDAVPDDPTEILDEDE